MVSALMGVQALPPCGLWPDTITDPSGRDWFVSRDLLVEGVVAWSSIGTLASAVEWAHWKTRKPDIYAPIWQLYAKFEQRYHNRPAKTFDEPVHRKLTMISDSQGVANITWLAGSLYTIHRQEGEVLDQIVYHFSIELSGKLSDILASATRRHGPSGGVDESDELGTNNATTCGLNK